MQIAQAQFQQTPFEEVEKILDECKADLENFYEEKAYGLIVESKRVLNIFLDFLKYFFSYMRRKGPGFLISNTT